MSTTSVLSVFKAFKRQYRLVPSRLFKIFPICLYFCHCSISWCLLNDSYLPPSSLPLLSPTSLFPCLLALCLSHSLSLFRFLSPPTHTHTHTFKPAQDVYFMLLSCRGLMTLNCLICLMSSGSGGRRSARCLSKSESARGVIGKGEASDGIML